MLNGKQKGEVKVRRAALTIYLMNEALVSHIEDDLKDVKQALWN